MSWLGSVPIEADKIHKAQDTPLPLDGSPTLRVGIG